MNDHDDELTGIFNDLTPQDFTPFSGRVAFDDFVTQNINAMRIAWAAADGAVNPVAFLATAGKIDIHTAEDGETLGQYIERVQQEARKMGATWLFVSRKTLVGNYQASSRDTIPDATDPAALEKAIASGLMVEGLFYYAERLEDGQRDCRHGMMRAEGDRLGELIEGNPHHQTVGFFSNILG